ncbi:MAG: iron ABC transporter permease [Desulfobulbus sp.]|nr:MAG: iron ABC transporter permease [Desulfobulbus sp.]RUM36927.1 MAG: iron ABC transporter permease [Desulfobulbus sp.]RUM41982.1 MAG: iron ABC transporter permease [Desulfobulbus sp.]
MPRIRTSYLVASSLAFFLLVFLVIPVGKVIYVAFQDSSTGALTLINFVDFFKTSLFRESFINSLYVAGMSVLFASIIAMPLAYFTTRFNFGGSIIIQTLGIVPLIMPPFVGAVAMQLLFGSNGSVNLLLDKWFGLNIPFMEGLNGVILVESIHYFPFILINLSAALNNIDRSMEEAAQNLGSTGMRLFRRIVLPLAMPGYLAGASLVFLKAFDDLGTPLLLNVNNMLATQAYLRISSIGISDPMGYVISVILVIFSLFSLWVSMLASRGKDYSGGGKGSSGLLKRDMRGWEKAGAYCLIIFLLVLVLSPHISLLLLSFGTIWSYSVLPDAFTTAHYVEVFSTTREYITNTLLYAGIAASFDVAIGVAISYVVLRTGVIGRRWLDYVATGALAVPGVVLGIGYLRTFNDFNVPFIGKPLASWWVIIVIALTIRRLPYALRACTAALHQVSITLEEAAENLGAGKTATVRKIIVPLMAGGIVAGFVTSFATATVELSATLMLVTAESDAPLAYGIYVFMQSAAGRGPGAALGLIAVVVVALGSYLAHHFIERNKRLQVNSTGQ